MWIYVKKPLGRVLKKLNKGLIFESWQMAAGMMARLCCIENHFILFLLFESHAKKMVKSIAIKILTTLIIRGLEFDLVLHLLELGR